MLALMKAVEEVLGKGEIYIFGPAVRSRFRSESDIAVAVVVEEPLENADAERILSKIWEGLERRGVPLYYPLEIHLVTEEERKMLEGSGIGFVNLEILVKPRRGGKGKTMLTEFGHAINKIFIEIATCKYKILNISHIYCSERE